MRPAAVSAPLSTRPCSAAEAPLRTPGGPCASVWETLSQPVLPARLLSGCDFKPRSEGGGAGWEALLCSHVDVCCLRGWLRCVTERNAPCAEDYRPACLRAFCWRGGKEKKRCNFMMKTYLCRDDVCTADCSSGTFGQMAIKVPLGSRCAHRAVSL